ncbi:MAG: lipoyl(octanoyl) transferase, partial [Bdellovibrio sp. CG10_big_fil_rev_8_21_14_0_10_47_8]
MGGTHLYQGGVKTTYFGLMSYDQSMKIQKQCYELVQGSGFPVVLGFEYYPVITLGLRAQAGQELMGDHRLLKEQGFEIVETDRGGQATLHSPGQLVIYPLVPLRKLGLGVRQFVEILEETTIQWLKSLKISSGRSEDAGVFTERGKIAFIGIRVLRGISCHGISINLSNDLSLFSAIRACGVSQRPLDSVSKQGHELNQKEAFDSWVL